MNAELNVSIEPMMEKDVEQSVELISASLNKAEAEWARKTMAFYLACKDHGLDSGRRYYIWRYQGKVHGLVGLHRYIWGPEENVWLSWFAVHPTHQRKNVGSAMIDAIEEIAKKTGYKKFLIETYDNPTFENAHSFYKAKGFSQMGRIEDYLPDGSAMLIFGKPLC